MLMPQELRKYAFNHAIRGYSTAEVDEYIEFLCTKYEEVYREHDELERKLIAALRALDQMKGRESQITALDAETKRVSARMLAEAEAQKKRIVADAEEYADRIIAEADAHVERQEQLVARMRQSVLAFRDELYGRYNAQIDQIEALTALAQSDEPLPAEDETAEEIEEEEILPEQEPAEEDAADEADEEAALAAEISETDEALMFYDASEEAKVLPVEEEVVQAAPVPRREANADEFYAIFESVGDEDKEEAAPAADGGDLMKFLEEFTVSYNADEEDDADGTEESEEDAEFDETDADEEGDGDDDLLRELRQAFDIHFETFTSEETKDSMYDFSSEKDDEEESVVLKSRRSEKKKEEKGR